MLLVLIGYMLLVMIAVPLLDWLRPRWSRSALIVATALPGPLVVIVGGLGWAGWIISRPPEPGEIDAGGMAFAAVLVVSQTAGVFSLGAGLLTSWFVTGLLRGWQTPR